VGPIAREDARGQEGLDGAVANSVLPASKLGGGIQYLLNHWSALEVYATDGQLPIDNNQCESLMKRIAIGRKNWLFRGEEKNGEKGPGKGAMQRFYSLIRCMALSRPCRNLIFEWR
jgi:hypothetical protein